MQIVTKTRLFRLVLWALYLPALLFVWPLARARAKSAGRLFFFFDRWVIGGSQRVFLDILESVGDLAKEVRFTRRPADDGFREAFEAVPNSLVRDVHRWTHSLLFRPFAVHFYAFYVNRHPGACAFGSNSAFYYAMLPFLRRRVRKVDLLHNFMNVPTGFQFYSLANCRRLDVRVVVDSNTRENIRRQYADHGVAPRYFERVTMIEPAVEIPPPFEKAPPPPLRVLYAGRGGVQKRAWLVDRIARHFMDAGAAIEFHFAGTMEADLSAATVRRAHMHGEVRSSEAMRDLYARCHVILLTSAWEGFPMVVKEGMAAGCVPLVTALPSYAMHLRDGENALFIDAVDDEDAVVRLGIERLARLAADPALVARLARSARGYAAQNFGKAHFLHAYRALLAGEGGRAT